MEIKSRSLPRFHQAAIASAFTLSAMYSNPLLAAECHSVVENPFVVNIATEDNKCDDFVSLREAIGYANNILGKDTITFADALKGQTIDVSGGYIRINESISIVGPEAETLMTLKVSSTDSLFDIESEGDRIDFDLNNVVLEQASASEPLIEMLGYGGDVNLDNIHTTDATKAYGLLRNETKDSETNDFHLTLKNSHISGSTFVLPVLGSRSRYTNSRGQQRISIIDSVISGNTGMALAGLLTYRNGYGNDNIEIKRSDISGNTFSYPMISSHTMRSGESIVTIDDSRIKENKSDTLVKSYSAFNDARINVSNSVISGNNVAQIFHSESESESSHVNLSNSTISDNTISEIGIYTYGFSYNYPDTNSINIQDSTLCDNITDYGGDLPGEYPLIQASNVSTLDISDSNICNNQLQAIRLHASYRSDATATIKNSAINNNHTTASGAGIYATDGGKGTKLDLNIIDSSISNNKSNRSGGGIAVRTYDPLVVDLRITNSTISGNQAGQTGDHSGGGIMSEGAANISLSSSTVVNNNSTGFGGGVAVTEEESPSFNIKNSIIADNTSAYGSADLYGYFTVENSLIKDTGSDTDTDTNTTINGTDIEQIGDNEGQIPDTGNNLLGVDPLLQDLALSGSSWVHQLSADSPAIGAGNTETENLTAFDQRGDGFKRVRTVNGEHQLDMGAVQYFAKPVAVNDAVSIKQNSANNVFDVLTNDAQNSDGLALDLGSIVIMSHPEHGSAYAKTDGMVIYTPSADFFGDDSFTYVVQDIDANTSDQASVNISVTEIVTPVEPEPKENESSSSSSGGSFNFWLLSLLAIFGLRRK